MGEPIQDHLYFGRLTEYYRRGSDKLPRVVAKEDLSCETLLLATAKDKIQLKRASPWLFSSPTGEPTIAFSIDFNGETSSIIRVLEDCYYADGTLGGTPLAESLLSTFSEGALRSVGGLSELGAITHQVVYPSATADNPPSQNDICQMIYRSDGEFKARECAVDWPTELNRGENWRGGIGEYVSVLYSHQGYFENSAFISAVQLVGAAATLRKVHLRAHEHLAGIRTIGPLDEYRERRVQLGTIADRLGSLVLDLSHGVEAQRDIGLLVPSLRVDEFHTVLASKMQLEQRSQDVLSMIQRLESAIEAKLSSVSTQEKDSEDRRRLAWGAAAGVVSTVAIPLGVLLGFFGINTSEVAARTSMFDLGRYGWIYLVAFGTVAFGFAVFLLLRVFIGQRSSEGTRNRLRSILRIIRRRGNPANRTSHNLGGPSHRSPHPSAPANRSSGLEVIVANDRRIHLRSDFDQDALRRAVDILDND